MRFSLALPFVIGFFGMFALHKFTPIENPYVRLALLSAIILLVYGVLYLRRRRRESKD